MIDRLQYWERFFFLNKGPVLGIKSDFMLGAADYMNLWFDKILEVGSLIGNSNVMFSVMED